jgi:hypothetical protein
MSQPESRFVFYNRIYEIIDETIINKGETLSLKGQGAGDCDGKMG